MTFPRAPPGRRCTRHGRRPARGCPPRGPWRRRLSESVAKARIAPGRRKRIVDIPRFFSRSIPPRSAFATDLDRIQFGPVPTPSHAARVPHQFHAPLLAEPPEAEYGALGGSFRRAPDRGAVKAAKSCGSQWAHTGRGSERSSQGARIGPGRGLRSSAAAPGLIEIGRASCRERV